MRSLSVLLVVATACTEHLSAPELLDDHAVAMTVAGDALYWAAERDGVVELARRTPDGTRRLWSRAIAEPAVVTLVAGPDGAVLVESPISQPGCARFHWIHHDGTSQDLTAAALCDAQPVAQLDGGLLFWVDSQTTFRFDLTTGEVTTWFDVPGATLLFPTARESYAGRDVVAPGFDLLRVDRNGDTQTLATVERADRFAISPDAIYWTRPGWDERPTTVTRVPRDGSGPAIDMLATPGLSEGAQPPFFEQMVWAADALWVTDQQWFYRVDDGELVRVGATDHRAWQLEAYDGALVMLTEGDEDCRMRVQLQRLPLR